MTSFDPHTGVTVSPIAFNDCFFGQIGSGQPAAAGLKNEETRFRVGLRRSRQVHVLADVLEIEFMISHFQTSIGPSLSCVRPISEAEKPDRVAEPERGLPKLLIAEDDDDFREALREEASSRGYVVLAASNGLQAKAMWRAEEPEVVIADLIMPGLGGLELATMLGSYGAMRPAIILMSGDREMRAAPLLRCSVDQIFEKPFKVDDLFESIQYTSMHRRMLRSYHVRIDESMARFQASSSSSALRECISVLKSFVDTMSMSQSNVMMLLHMIERAQNSFISAEDVLGRAASAVSLLHARNQHNLASLMEMERLSMRKDSPAARCGFDLGKGDSV